MIKIIGVGDILPGGLLHGTNQKLGYLKSDVMRH